MRVLLIWLGASSQCAGPHPAHAIVPNRIVAIVRIGHVGVEDGVHGNDTNPGDQGGATVSLATGTWRSHLHDKSPNLTHWHARLNNQLSQVS